MTLANHHPVAMIKMSISIQLVMIFSQKFMDPTFVIFRCCFSIPFYYTSLGFIFGKYYVNLT